MLTRRSLLWFAVLSLAMPAGAFAAGNQQPTSSPDPKKPKKKCGNCSNDGNSGNATNTGPSGNSGNAARRGGSSPGAGAGRPRMQHP